MASNNIDEITPNGTVTTLASVGNSEGLAFNTPLPVPEPSTYALMALGLVALASRIVSRRRA